MEHHGSESYFVIGEGLLGETVGGRARSLAAAVEAAVPPFRFSRMGPNGIGQAARRARPEEDRRRDDRERRRNPGQIPAGFTYLGQFIDHDLTFDKTTVMLGAERLAAQLLQARSPSLDLDSLYGAGPTDPGSAQVLRGRRHPPEDGQDGRRRRSGVKQGFDLPRGAARRRRPSARRSSPTRGTTRTSRSRRRTWR